MTTDPKRRHLRLESLGDLRLELGRIEQADQEGRLETTGQWTAGQILAHLAAWIEYGYEGYPMRKPSLLLRWFLRWKLPSYLQHGMAAGVRIPGVPGGTYGIDRMEVSKAAERLHRAIGRLEAKEPCPHDSPAFGPMSFDDRVRLNLRHAELHLGFLRY